MPANISPLPSQHPRERLLHAGAKALSDMELLTILISPGVRGRSASHTAHALLHRFGNLAALYAAPRHLVEAELGMGAARWCALQAGLELARRSVSEALHQQDALSSPEEVGRFVALSLQHSPQEVFMVLFLDSRHRLLAAEEMFRGTLAQTAVYPREVVRRALERNAAAVILAHNHPSGLPEPSAADRHLTQVLQKALQSLDIPVLDHLIVGSGRRFSFAEHGML